METVIAAVPSMDDYDACSNRPCGDTTNDDDNQESEETVRHRQDEHRLVWRKPWMVALVFFYLFYILFVYGSIIQRYWVKENFKEVLPGLDTT